MTPKPVSTAAVLWFCAVTIFLSAFLLFQVQPIISRMILPWFGGSPAVWTTCMLFFQVLLLGGYAYAHYLNRLTAPRYPVAIHLGLLLLAACVLPIIPDPAWKPQDATDPTWRILALLLINLGLPYFMLSSTGPLVQAWFSRAVPDRSPYRLYALSNIGSLGALLSYPFLIEPWLTSNRQGIVWSIGFGVFALASAALALIVMQSAAPANASPRTNAAPLAPVSTRMSWLLLPALASAMLLAVTAHLCQDVAVIPFFWIVPLSLYLLSFVICFDAARWYRRGLFGWLFVIGVCWISIVMLDTEIEQAVNGGIEWLNPHLRNSHIAFRLELNGDYFGEIGELVQRITGSETVLVSDFVGESIVYLAVFFSLCMLCHGELVRRKPPVEHLTRFYLMVAAGGALGGVFVALICPLWFSTYFEMGLILVAGFLLAGGVLWQESRQKFRAGPLWESWAAGLFAVAMLSFIVRAQLAEQDDNAILVKRNFYGVLTVREYGRRHGDRMRELLDGRIVHGSQFLDPKKRRTPTTYYNTSSGAGLALTLLRRERPIRVGLVGLGAGTLAAYGVAGDYYCFYEINPNVRDIATSHFSYIADSAAEVRVELGDARLSLERQEPQDYDFIGLDAFSGDAIPVHLLTREAFEVYFRHLKPDGVIAVHTSNRHLDLIPVVQGIARHSGARIAVVNAEEEDEGPGEAESEWILVTHSPDFLDTPALRSVSTSPDQDTSVPLWTDQYSNLFQILE